MERICKCAVAGACALGFAFAAMAGEADVVGARAVRAGDAYSFDVTVAHADAGWDHYADRWDVVAPDGSVLGTRVLLHPHDTEQPFTRSLGGVRVPAGIAFAILRAHDRVHGYGGAEMRVDLPPQAAGG